MAVIVFYGDGNGDDTADKPSGSSTCSLTTSYSSIKTLYHGVGERVLSVLRCLCKTESGFNGILLSS